MVECRYMSNPLGQLPTFRTYNARARSHGQRSSETLCHRWLGPAAPTPAGGYRMASNERPEGTRAEALGVEHVELLGKVDLFHNLDHVVLAQVASHLRRAVVGADEAVCRYGEPGDSLYVIARGTFAVLVPSPD